MIDCIIVGAGGAAGAVCRYLFGILPFKIDTAFPVKTFLINLIGSFCIGLIAALAQKNGGLNPRSVLFLKAGFCGGFTTFSTFSLENLTLLQNGAYGTAVLYMMFSVAVCVAGAAAGMALVK